MRSSLAANESPNERSAIRPGGHRIRQENYRILYELRDMELIVDVGKLGHRREVNRTRQDGQVKSSPLVPA